MKSSRKFIPTCDLQISNSNSNIIENYEKVTVVLIFFIVLINFGIV